MEGSVNLKLPSLKRSTISSSMVAVVVVMEVMAGVNIGTGTRDTATTGTRPMAMVVDTAMGL